MNSKPLDDQAVDAIVMRVENGTATKQQAETLLREFVQQVDRLLLSQQINDLVSPSTNSQHRGGEPMSPYLLRYVADRFRAYLARELILAPAWEAQADEFVRNKRNRRKRTAHQQPRVGSPLENPAAFDETLVPTAATENDDARLDLDGVRVGIDLLLEPTLGQAFGVESARVREGRPPVSEETRKEVATEILCEWLAGRSLEEAVAAVAERRKREKLPVASEREIRTAWADYKLDAYLRLRVSRDPQKECDRRIDRPGTGAYWTDDEKARLAKIFAAEPWWRPSPSE